MLRQRDSLELALSFFNMLAGYEDLIRGSDRTHVDIDIAGDWNFRLDLTVGWCANMTRWFKQVLDMTNGDVITARKDLKDYQELLGYDRHCPIKHKHYNARALYDHHRGTHYMWGIGEYADARWAAMYDIMKHLERFLEETE